MNGTDTLLIPDEAYAPLWQLDRSLYGRGTDAAVIIERVATPVVVAELLALADRVAALHGNGGPTYRDGFDEAIGAVRELIADRCDELGTRVEEL